MNQSQIGNPANKLTEIKCFFDRFKNQKLLWIEMIETSKKDGIKFVFDSI
jgi:hypothetical protein